MKKIQIISDKNLKSQRIKKSLIKVLDKIETRKSNITIVILFFGGFALFSSLMSDFLIFCDFKFLSEIICIFFILMVPSARLELALRKRQGFSYHYSFRYTFVLWSGLYLKQLSFPVSSLYTLHSSNVLARYQQLSLHRIYQVLHLGFHLEHSKSI